MTAKRRRVVVLSLLFCVFAASVCFCLYEWHVGSNGGAFLREDVNVSLRMEDAVLLSPEDHLPAPRNGRVTLKNGETFPVEYLLLSDGAVADRGTLSAGEEVSAAAPVSQGATFSLAVKSETVRVAYLSTAADTREAAQFLQGGDLVFTSPVSFDLLELGYSFRLFGNFSFASLSLRSADDAPVVLSPDTAFSGSVLIDAPESRVFWRKLTPLFPDAQEEYYITARSLNGKRLDPLSFPVQTADMLSALADPSVLPRLPEDARVTVTAPLSLREDVAFFVPFSLTVSAPITFGDYQLSLETQSRGRMEIKTARGASVFAPCFAFSAPYCDLYWACEDGTVPALSTVEKFYSVASYNGEKLSLGGDGTAVPNLMIYPHGKESAEDAMAFSVLGNLLVCEADPLVSLSDLNDAPFDLFAREGSAVLEGDLATGCVVTRDSAGKERRFALRLLRQDLSIPGVFIETEKEEPITSKRQYVSATFSMSGAGESVLETHIRIRGRGNSTWKWDKKPYKISFDEDVSLFGLAPARSYALFASYADKSLMRNRVASVMAQELSFSYCPTQFFVHLFLNGTYQGVYGLGEHLEEGEGRVEVLHKPGARDCGFFLEVGGVESDVNVRGIDYFHAGLLKFILIKSPDPEDMTSEQLSYIRSYLQKANEAVKSGEGIEEYVDMTSLIDWLIMTEWTNNTDCAWRRSTYMTKDAGGKLVMGPVWDFDLAFGNFSKDKAGFDTWVSFSEDDDYVGETWSTYLLQDPAFRTAFKARFLEVRDRVLHTALDEIDRNAADLSDAAALNFEKWDILGRKVAFERHDTSDYPTYESQIRYLKDFLIDRAAWLTEQVEAW